MNLYQSLPHPLLSVSRLGRDELCEGGGGGNGWLGRIPFLPQSPLMSLFFILTLKMLRPGLRRRARECSRHPCVPARSGVQFSLSFRAGIFDREERGEHALGLRGHAKGRDPERSHWSLQVLFCPFTPAPNTDHGGRPGLAGQLCSQNPGPPASCSSRLGARNHNSNSYNDAGKQRHLIMNNRCRRRPAHTGTGNYGRNAFAEVS